MARDLDCLVRLQVALNEAQVNREQLDGVPESMRELHEEHQNRSEVIRSLQEVIAESDTGRRTAEAAAHDIQLRLTRFQEQVNRVSTQREYGSLLSEIDTAKAELTVHEDEALALLEQAETAKEQIEAEREGFEELDESYQKELQKWELEKPSVATRLEHTEAEIEELRAAIPKRTLLRFERLLERLDGQALAPISKVEKTSRAPDVWHCSNCNYSVRPQVVVDIMNNGGLNQCDSCQRFLYWQEEETA